MTFQCESNGAATVEWRHNNTVIVADDDKYYMNQRFLTVRDVVGTDEGDYSCTFGGLTKPAGCLIVYGERE